MLKFYCEYKNIDPGGYPHVEIKKTRHLFRSLESCMEKKAVFFFNQNLFERTFHPRQHSS